MRTRRLGAVLGLAAVVLLGAGCAQEAAPTEPARPLPAASPEPTRGPASAALAAAADRMRKTTCRVTVSAGSGATSIHGGGSVDGPGGRTAMVLEMNVPGGRAVVQEVLIGGHAWLRYTGVAGVPRDWMHVDLAKLGEKSDLRRSLRDPSFSGVLASAAGLRWDGDRRIKGTLDMSGSLALAPDLAEPLGDRLVTAPFTATLDAQGRLLSLVVALSEVLPAGAGGDITVSYGGYGEPVRVTPPSGKVVEAPAAVLGRL